MMVGGYKMILDLSGVKHVECIYTVGPTSLL